MIALVTGVTAGFGQAIAKRLITDGHRVIGVGRRKERLDGLREVLGDHFLGLDLDVTHNEEVVAKLKSLPAGWNDIDVLVNNAGLALGMAPAHQSDMKDWNTMVQTNILGVLHCTNAILPGMVSRKRGHIVNLGSVAGDFPYPGGNVYGATKAFIKQFSLNLRADLAGTPVRVTNLEPGLCGGTEFSAVRFKGDEVKASAVYAGTDPILPEDVAEAVSWVISLPSRVNVNRISMMAVCQSFSPFAIHRTAG